MIHAPHLGRPASQRGSAHRGDDIWPVHLCNGQRHLSECILVSHNTSLLMLNTNDNDHIASLGSKQAGL